MPIAPMKMATSRVDVQMDGLEMVLTALTKTNVLSHRMPAIPMQSVQIPLAVIIALVKKDIMVMVGQNVKVSNRRSNDDLTMESRETLEV